MIVQEKQEVIILSTTIYKEQPFDIKIVEGEECHNLLFSLLYEENQDAANLIGFKIDGKKELYYGEGVDKGLETNEALVEWFDSTFSNKISQENFDEVFTLIWDVVIFECMV